MADAAAFSIEFNDIVNASSLNGLQNLSATVIGIPPLRMLKPTRIVDEVQRVTKFTWTIPPVRHV